MKILRLTLKKKWFDLILSGKKTIEYRERKKHWISRLVDSKKDLIKFDLIIFTNGYGKDRPYMKVEHICTSFSLLYPPENGEKNNPRDYAIILGQIIETGNLEA